MVRKHLALAFIWIMDYDYDSLHNDLFNKVQREDIE